MAVTLISPAPDFNDPLGLLAACHGRIEAQCATLLKLAPHIKHHGVDEQAAQAASKAIKYFSTSGRHHHADEEEDLFPLLQEHARRMGANDMLDLMAKLLKEHESMEGAWSDLAPFLEKIAASRAVDPADLPIDRFAALYRAHIAQENGLLFPFAQRVLSRDEQDTLGQNMAKRRAQHAAHS